MIIASWKHTDAKTGAVAYLFYEDAYSSALSLAKEVFEGELTEFHSAIAVLDTGIWVDVTEDVMRIVNDMQADYDGRDAFGRSQDSIYYSMGIQ